MSYKTLFIAAFSAFGLFVVSAGATGCATDVDDGQNANANANENANANPGNDGDDDGDGFDDEATEETAAALSNGQPKCSPLQIKANQEYCRNCWCPKVAKKPNSKGIVSFAGFGFGLGRKAIRSQLSRGDSWKKCSSELGLLLVDGRSEPAIS